MKDKLENYALFSPKSQCTPFDCLSLVRMKCKTAIYYGIQGCASTVLFALLLMQQKTQGPGPGQ